MAWRRSLAAGRGQIEGMIRLDIEFEIDEVVVVSQPVAHAPTRSAATTTPAQVPEGNQELFVLLRADASADWRIGQHIFSTTQLRS
jgi:hypothetical protein